MVFLKSLSVYIIVGMGVFLGGALTAHATTISGMVPVPSGTYHPFYPLSPSQKKIVVSAFTVDKFPVTNKEFLDFVKRNPQWQKGKISPLFADKRYLENWARPSQLGPSVDPEQPVVQVSWFAAKAFCQSEGKRLLTENEWEYIANASETNADGRLDLKWRNKVLDWYTKPTTKIQKVGQRKPNYFGVHDLHGLVWEWVLDFNSSLLSTDPRESGDALLSRFCGSGALAASEKDDYPTFMRMAFRSSLKANYTTANLGFRCAQGDSR